MRRTQLIVVVATGLVLAAAPLAQKPGRIVAGAGEAFRGG